MRSFRYRHPCRDRRRGGHLALLALSVLVFFIPSLVGVQVATAAGIGPKIVDGHVYDSSLAPVAGASVEVKIMSGPTVRETQTDTTDSLGFYTVSFDPNNWDVGDTITTTATKGADSGSASTTANDSVFQTLDATLGAAIPEFSQGGVVLVVGSVIVLMLVGAGRRRAR